MRRLLRVSGGVLAVLVLGLGALVAFLQVMGPRALQHPDTPYPQLQSSADPEVIARGRYLVYGPAHCAQCHSSDRRDDPAQLLQESPLSGGLPFVAPFGTWHAANLTPHLVSGIGAWTDAELARTVRTGVLRNGDLSIWMSLAAAQLSDADVVAVMSFLRSQPPIDRAVPPAAPNLLGHALVWFVGFQPRDVVGPAHVEPSDTPSVARGAYLADSAAGCKGCHTPMDPSTFQIDPSRAFQGGTVEPDHEDASMEFAAPNLTPHATAGVSGRLTEDAFVARLRAGRVHLHTLMPWENYARMTEADLRSVYQYLRTLPPSDVDNGPSYRPAGWKP